MNKCFLCKEIDANQTGSHIIPSFLMKRKTLVNNLIKSYSISRVEAEEALIKIGAPITARAEDLSPLDFINLSKLLK